MRDSKQKVASSRIRLLRSRGFKQYFFLLVLTTIITWATGLLDNHYQPLQGVAGYGEVFPDDSESWRLVGNEELLNPEPGKFLISADTGFQTRAEYLVDLPEMISTDYTHVRVRSIVKTLERPSRSSLKTDAGVLIRLRDANGDVVSRAWVSQLTGEFTTQKAEQLIALDSKATSAQLLFTNRASDGRFELEQASLDIVRVSPAYELAIFPALVVLWGASLLMGGYYLATRMGTKRTLLLGGALLVLVGGVILPTGLREILVTPVHNLIKSTGLPGANLPLLYYYKIGHFLTFFVVSLVLFQNKIRLVLSRFDLFAVMFLLAVATEGAQLHLFFRTTQILDIVIDVSGVVLALLVHQLLRKINSKKRSRRLQRTIKTRRNKLHVTKAHNSGT